MHRNPVKRGLVREPGQWPWSSFRFYLFGENGRVTVNEERAALAEAPFPSSALFHSTFVC